jgi:hypothetical protein
LRPDHKSKITDHKSFQLLTLLPYATLLLLALLSWNSWIEPYVDTGRELMVPRRLAEGERLYRDVQFFHGPLAPWLGAGIERISGRSLPARSAFAAVLTLVHLALLERLVRRWMSPARAALATAIAVAAAFFLRPGGWLFPFSFDLALAVTALTGALLFSTRERPADAPAAFCLWLALLARPELAVPGIALLAFSAGRKPRRLMMLVPVPLAGAAVAYAIASAGIPFPTLVTDGWLRMLDPPAAFRNVYLSYAGLDRVGLRTAELLLASILLALAAVVPVAAAFAAGRAAVPGSRSTGAAVLAVAGSMAVIAGLRLHPPVRFAETLALFPPLVRVVPIVLACAALARIATRLTGRRPSGSLAAVPDAVLWLAALFGARLFLAAGYVGPYDAFFLPLPIVVALAGLYGLAERGAPAVGSALPAACSAALAVFLLYRTAATADAYRRPSWSRIETPAGTLRLPEPEASTTQLALAELERRLAAGSTLVGFPEGGFFEYVLGLRDPLPVEQFFPGQLDEEGERRVALRLAERPPDAILYANVLAVGEGARAFGQDYLVGLDRTVRSISRPVSVLGPGARPGARIGDPGFFVEIRVPAGRSGP